MAISVNWGTKVITVPKVDLNLIQSSPIEILELDINTFRLALRALEDDEEGISYQITHNNVAPIDVGGITLARVIEIINDYTITFEDGQYAVNLIGANSNIGDRVNVNQVSVRSFNSAGLVTSAGIESIEYQNKVTIWEDSGFIGTVYPYGTYRQPVNNITNAALIALNRGFSRYDFINDFTFGASDNLDTFEIWGEAPSKTSLVFPAGISTIRSEIFNAVIEGDVGGAITVSICHIKNLTDIGSIINQTNFHNCLFENVLPLANIKLKTTGTMPINFIDCWSGVAGVNRPIIDINGSTADINIRNFSGGVTIKNATGGNFSSYDFESGTIEFDSTCTDGLAVIRGDVLLIDNSGVGFTVYDFSTAALVASGLVDLTSVLQIVTKLEDYTINKLTIDIARAPEIYLQIWDDAGTTVLYEHRLKTTLGTDPTIDNTSISSRDDEVIL